MPSPRPATGRMTPGGMTTLTPRSPMTPGGSNGITMTPNSPIPTNQLKI